jgi:2-phosphoglycerate kinase
MSYPRVILIGGAPMTGKTTVAHMLAATLGYGCLATDDLGEAIRAVTTKDSIPISTRWMGTTTENTMSPARQTHS